MNFEEMKVRIPSPECNVLLRYVGQDGYDLDGLFGSLKMFWWYSG